MCGHNNTCTLGGKEQTKIYRPGFEPTTGRSEANCLDKQNGCYHERVLLNHEWQSS